MSHHSPLGRARGLGSAKNGTGHWWAQRLTAIALVPLVLWFVISLIPLVGGGYNAAVNWVSSPFVAVLLIVTIIATFHHAQLGLQVVIEDYVHGEGSKLTAIILVRFTAVLLTVGGIFAVLKIAFGA